MTQTTNARLAGITFLLYIVVGITHMVAFGQATRGVGTPEKLASMVRHAAAIRFSVLLALLTFAIAVTLAVALYALTRVHDRDLALLALWFRGTEGVLAAVSSVRTLGLLSIATAVAGGGADSAAANALAGMLFTQGSWTGNIAAICFALGSTIYSYLFLRARSIPVALAWLGVASSVLLVIALPLELVDLLVGRLTWLVWMPMLVFEVALALWLIIKGVQTTRVGGHEGSQSISA